MILSKTVALCLACSTLHGRAGLLATTGNVSLNAYLCKCTAFCSLRISVLLHGMATTVQCAQLQTRNVTNISKRARRGSRTGDTLYCVCRA